LCLAVSTSIGFTDCDASTWVFFENIFGFILEVISGVKGGILCFVKSIILGHGQSGEEKS